MFQLCFLYVASEWHGNHFKDVLFVVVERQALPGSGLCARGTSQDLAGLRGGSTQTGGPSPTHSLRTLPTVHQVNGDCHTPGGYVFIGRETSHRSCDWSLKF